MKKIISVICALCLFIQPLAAFAADTRTIVYGKKEKNTSLKFPLEDYQYAKEGVAVIEGEDLPFNSKTTTIVEDSDASGGKAIYIAATNNTDISKVSNEDFSLTFYNDKEGSNTFYYWFRLKGSGKYLSQFVDYKNTGKWEAVVNAFRPTQDEINQWIWKRGISQTLDAPGEVTTRFCHREQKMTLDKVIITTSSSFTPSGMNPDPYATNTSSVGEEVALSGDAYGSMSDIKVFPKKGVHPRLYMTPDDIPVIKERVAKNAISKQIYDRIATNANKAIPAIETIKGLGSIGSADNNIADRAFLYALGDLDAEKMREGINYYVTAIEKFTPTAESTYGTSAQNRTRHGGEFLWNGCKIYDWANDLLTDEEKQIMRDGFLEIIKVSEVGWPPIVRGLHTGHAHEYGTFINALMYGITVYDEDPAAYNLVAAQVCGPMFAGLREFIPSSYTVSIGAYMGGIRTDSWMTAEKMLRALGDSNPIHKEIDELHLHRVYMTTPAGYWFPEGDDTTIMTYKPGTRRNSLAARDVYAGYFYDNPYIQWEGLTDTGLLGVNYDVEMLTLVDFDKLNPKSTEYLPLTRFSKSPMTTMVARTNWQEGWDSNGAVAFVTMQEYKAYDHHHMDTGHFMFYYKGMLAHDTGRYTYDGSSVHKQNWQDLTIAHNAMLIENNDPDWFFTTNNKNYLNDGGQKRPAYQAISAKRYPQYKQPYDDLSPLRWKNPQYERAYTKATYAGPNEQTPAFSYISSDISKAYNYEHLNYYKTQPDGYERSFVFMDLYNDDYPAAMVVYDNVTSIDANYKKSWLLHSQLEPTYDPKTGVYTMYRNDLDGYNNGKLVNKTLTPAPKDADFEVIGGAGRSFEVKGVNYPVPGQSDEAVLNLDIGHYTYYISPKKASKDDKFLNVMYVTDYDRNLPELEIYKEFGAVYTGATIMDRMVTFSLTRDNIKQAFSLSVRDNGYPVVKCLITDLDEGKWKISGNGVEYVVESKKGQNVGEFEVPPGVYNVEPVAVGNVTSFDNGPAEKSHRFGDFRISKNSDYIFQTKPGKVMDGKAYVAIDGIFTRFGDNVVVKSVSEDHRTVTFGNNIHTYTVTADSLEATHNGKPITLTNPPRMYEGELYATVDDFFTVLLIRTAEFLPQYKLLKIQVKNSKPMTGIDMKKVVDPVAITSEQGFETGEHGHDTLADHDLTTWNTSEGMDQEFTYDLGKVVTIDKVAIAWYNATKRTQYFDLYLSDDGVNWRAAITEGENGRVPDGEFDFFTIKENARYVKMVSNGNSTSRTGGYNSIWEFTVLTNQEVTE